MKIGNAIAIFTNLDTCVHSEKEKAMAIHMVLQMPTHNSITKADILKAAKYLWSLIYEFEEDEKRCRVCGCTWNNACPGGCYWVEEDLCSQCADAALGG